MNMWLWVSWYLGFCDVVDFKWCDDLGNILLGIFEFCLIFYIWFKFSIDGMNLDWIVVFRIDEDWDVFSFCCWNFFRLYCEGDLIDDFFVGIGYVRWLLGNEIF